MLLPGPPSHEHDCAARASERRSGWLPGVTGSSTSTSAISPRADTTRHTEVSSESSPMKAGAVLDPPSARPVPQTHRLDGHPGVQGGLEHRAAEVALGAAAPGAALGEDGDRGAPAQRVGDPGDRARAGHAAGPAR